MCFLNYCAAYVLLSFSRLPREDILNAVSLCIVCCLVVVVMSQTISIDRLFV